MVKVEIVAKVDELMALCDQLEAQFAITEADGRRLQEAVLSDALSSPPKGEPQRHPDAARAKVSGAHLGGADA